MIPGSILVQENDAIRPNSGKSNARSTSIVKVLQAPPTSISISQSQTLVQPTDTPHRLSLHVLTPRKSSTTSLSTVSLSKDILPEHSLSSLELGERANETRFKELQRSPTQASPTSEGFNTSPAVLEQNRKAIQELLSQVGNWNWNIFEFESLASKPLYTLGLYLFHEAGLVGKFSIPIDKLRHFLLRIEAGYHADVPYHNSTHACDVLHATNFFINTNAITGRLTDNEILGAYLSAIIHDYDHPGLNNQFLVSTRHSKAVFYNDRSVLENHHLASAWAILLKEESNILCNLSKEEYRTVREQCVDMVLATDLSGHFAMLSAFKNKVFAAGTFDLDNRDDRSLFWRILIKCADVSNLTKDWAIYDRWLERIMAEFFRQGDDEKKLGLPVSPFMDRETVQIASSQISFLDFICLPMYETFTRVAQIPEILDTLSRNRSTLITMREKDKDKKK
ncbi:cAMP-specific 3',5'-cyclic phosphodiesterase 4A [Phlyctochytrium planicorne]|nr:cAMP-specific 3',5'-cyclic phosphodiesterase 4A [Phlyctochytrium planicorne]